MFPRVSATRDRSRLLAPLRALGRILGEAGRLEEELRRPIEEAVRETLREALGDLDPAQLVLRELYTFRFQPPSLEEMLREMRESIGESRLLEELEHVAKRASGSGGGKPANG